MLFHLSQQTTSGIAFRGFSGVGYLAVAYFFMLSGYGLMSGYLRNQGEYLKLIIKKRVPTVIIPWVLSSILYILIYLILFDINYIKLLLNYENMFLVITISWYVVSLVFFYIIFYLSFRIVNNIKLSLLILFTLVNVYILIMNHLGLGGWWYYSSYAFLVGVIYKNSENRIKVFINNDRRLLLFISMIAILFVFAYILRFINSITVQSEIISIFSRLIASADFVCGVVLIGKNGVSIINYGYTWVKFHSRFI